jgi:hypothetical protein
MSGFMNRLSAIFFIAAVTAFSTSARAQGESGACNMHLTRERMPLFYQNGEVFFTSPRLNGRVINARPDPSGLHFLQMRSATAQVAYWVTWTSEVISITNNGYFSKVGDCSFDPQLMQAFHRPRAAPPQPVMNLVAGFDGTTVKPGPIAMPGDVFTENIYNAPPVLATAALAQKCKDSSNGSRDQYYACVLTSGASVETVDAYKCATNTRSPEEAALCILGSRLGSADRANVLKVQNCYQQHGQNWNNYPVCLAAAEADPKVMDLVHCARQSFVAGQEPNYWSMGTCALGPELFNQFHPNAEAQIAIQCATQSRGNPKVFVGCTGGQLTMRELDKCLTDGFGENGCFGKNNTLTKVYDQIGEGIAQAFGGKNGAMYLAWRAATFSSNPREAIRVMNNVSSEVRKMGDDVSNEVQRGMDKLGDAASKVIPQVKIGKPRGKIFGKKWSI